MLIGTQTIAASERLARLLDEHGLCYQQLNGKQTEQEAEIIARAGQRGTITIATNMAGRGADIRVEEEAAARGGLHVIAAQRHDSSRVDRQLIGRSARQGTPGSAQFFVSADDELLNAHGAVLVRRMKQLAPDGQEISLNFDSQVPKPVPRIS